MRLNMLTPPMFLFCLAPSAIDGQIELKRLSDAHQMFLLRDALPDIPAVLTSTRGKSHAHQ
jgi:hypothetical protein